MSIFIGKYTALLDEKSRCVIPSFFKRELPEDSKLILEKDPYEHCLNLYTQDEWQQKVKRIKASVNPNDPRQSSFLSRYFEEVVLIPLSDIGRISLPKEMLEYAGIKKEIMFTGQGSRMRIWDALRHEETRLSDQEYADLTKELLGGPMSDLLNQ